jgi:glycosyltransferase involved in cell wall biosynthesis
MEISVILPVYNEAENIERVISEIDAVLTRTGKAFEIIAIDDGSRDGSQKILETIATSNPQVRALFFRANRGQSAAFDAGFRHVSGKYVVTMDADGQNDPNDIPRMIQHLETGFDFVTGWRRNRKDGFFLRKLPSKIANRIILKFMKTPIHDLGCSLKVYRREIADELRLYGEMHRFISILVEGLGARVGEVEVNHRPRTAGVSKYGLSRTVKVFLDLLTVWFMRGYQTKPIYVFGGIGFGLLSVSFLLSLYVLYQKIQFEIWVHRNPLFSIAAIFAVIGVQFIATGLLAEIVVRTYFESRAKPVYTIAKAIGISPQALKEAAYDH